VELASISPRSTYPQPSAGKRRNGTGGATPGLRHGWGKGELAPLLWEDGERVSISTVGRILRRLKARRELWEPVRSDV